MNIKKIGIGIFGLCLIAVSTAFADVNVANLRVEYRANPLGIDVRAPRLSWQLQSSERGERQTAYRVLVASSTDLLKRGQGDLWNSGKVVSDQSTQLPYAGKSLAARQQCFWKVQTWDKAGKVSGWSPVASWEIGLPEAADWADASWIRLAKDTRLSPLKERSLQTKNMKEPRLGEAFPAPLFRKEFEIKSPVVRARAYVCGVGYNEVYVNGQRLGNAVLDPGQTTYDVRAFYVTHEITKLLQQGQNAVGVMLGNGFFGQNQAFGGGLSYGQPALIAKIVVDFANGTTQTIATDESWKAETGLVVFDNVYAGESYDARAERSGWNTAKFDDSQWQTAIKIPPVANDLQAQMIPPIKTIRTLKPVAVIAGENGKWIFDLGQNIAGWARIKIQAPAGTQLTMTYAEVLAANGKELDYGSTGVPATGVVQTEIYVCKGGGVETWSPRFTYHGFRYVEVAGLPVKPAADFLEGVLVCTAVETAGSFSCSDELLNRIYRASLWTIEDNIHGLLEYCPHREKCAWLGDTHSVAETVIYNFDAAQLWTKFEDDIGTTLGRGGVTYWGQKATPGIPCNIAIGKRLCQEARPDWGAAEVLMPWYLYTYYGDQDVFTRHYEDMKRWVNYVNGLRENGIVTKAYGDWCPPGSNTQMECPPPLSATVLHYGTLRIMQKIAVLLGKTDDAALFASDAESTRTALNKKYYDSATHSYGSQTANAIVLRFQAFPDSEADAVARALAGDVTGKHKGHAFVGIHGGRPLYMELCNYGYDDVAFGAAQQTTFPSYGYSLANGMTTWPETPLEFSDTDPMIGRTKSQNHPMQSGFAVWFHESIGGIKPAASGFKQITLDPHGFNQIEWAKAEHDSPYGPIKSEWSSHAGAFEWNIAIPANTTATVCVPVKANGAVTEGGKPVGQQSGIKFLRIENGRAVYEVESGTYKFKSAL